jgi:hypothetical protein
MHFGFGMEYPATGQPVTPFGIVCAEVKLAELGPVDGPGTHQAGLQGYVKGTIGQVLAAKGSGRRRNGQNFGMGRRVAELFHLVVRPRNHPVVAYHHGADRHLSSSKAICACRQASSMKRSGL